MVELKMVGYGCLRGRLEIPTNVFRRIKGNRGVNRAITNPECELQVLFEKAFFREASFGQKLVTERAIVEAIAHDCLSIVGRRQNMVHWIVIR